MKIHASDQAAVIAFLSRPSAYEERVAGASGGRVDRVETHVSIVFLFGERAYKLKRAVRYPYLDFSTPERRRACCEAEVAVNQRTAPELYLGVVPITQEPDEGLALGGAGPPVDWVVEMVRFDETTLFDRMADRGELRRRLMEYLAEQIARFHAAAEPRPNRDNVAGLQESIAHNAESFAAFASGTLDSGRVDRLMSRSRDALEQLKPLLQARRKAGRVRHCHGDLHLRNICLVEGQPVLFDAIEFSPTFAEIDTFYDLAFLLMDLDSRHLRRLAGVVLNRYLDVAADEDAHALLPLFLSLRAQIRSHVSAAAAKHQSDPGQSEKHRQDAERYFALATRCLSPPPPRLVAVGGLSGTGKSRLARALAPDLGATPGARIVRTDVVRKRLAGVPMFERLDREFYSKAMTERTYRTCYEQVRRVLESGHAAIMDAVFAQYDQRQAVAALAREAGVPFQGFWLEAAPEILEARIRDRGRNVSDATVGVLREQLTYDLGSIDWLRIDNSGQRKQTLKTALLALGVGKDANETLPILP
ncbi:MAG: hypothetical protein EXQ86_10375 [Rhodospirillales bacterium]|nr:hypothetical protein [Rhodospirillales bacterium]